MTLPAKAAEDAPPTLAAWRELAARELKGAPLSRLTSRSPEGVEIRPLVTADEVRGPVAREVLLARPARGWAICQELRQVSPTDAGRAASEDMSQGADRAWFVLDEALAAGLPGAPGRPGVALGGAEDLGAALAGVDPGAAVLEVGLLALPAAALLAAAAERRGTPLTALRGGVCGDPLALLASLGGLGWPIDHAYQDMAEVTRWAEAGGTGLRTVLVDASAWHDAGATAADEVALALAAGLEHLRGLGRCGVAPEVAARRTIVAVAVGRDLLLEVAKLRALRSLWARVMAACGVGPAGQAPYLHARGSRRELSALDPWVNMIRATAQGVCAALGGADSLALPAMDEALGEPDERGRRVARNTQLVLREESHLGATADPVGGSHSLEELTGELARAAWERLRGLEAEGGLLASLRAGAVQARLAAQAQAQAQAAATLRLPILGASRFAAPEERPTGARPGDRAGALAAARARGTWPEQHGSTTFADVRAALAAGAGLCGLRRAGAEAVAKVDRGRLAAPFEALRAAAPRARVALVPVGDAASVRPRVEFSRAYLPVGGFEVVECEASEDPAEALRRFAAAGAAAAVICGADAAYPEVVPALVPGLRAAGARAVVLAGRPKDQAEALRAAGVDVFISLGGDALAALGELQRRVEVRP